MTRILTTTALLLVGYSLSSAVEHSPLLSIRGRAHQAAAEAKSFMHAVAEPIREVKITSPASGPIGEVLVEEGSHVSEGQTLLTFDTQLTEARLAMAEAEHQRSKSAVNALKLEYQLAASRFKNTATAYREDAATRTELVESQIRWLQAEARYRAATDEVKQARQSRNYAEVENKLRVIAAPFTGIVLRIAAVPGNTPTAQDVLLHLVDTSKLRVHLYVPVSELQQLKTRARIRLRAEAPVSKPLEARVILVDEVIDPATQTVRCVLEIDNGKGVLPSGFRVRM